MNLDMNLIMQNDSLFALNLWAGHKLVFTFMSVRILKLYMNL